MGSGGAESDTVSVGRCTRRRHGLRREPCARARTTVAPPVPRREPAWPNASRPLRHAPSVKLIPRRLLFGTPDKASPRISPDGKSARYLAPVNGVLNVWVGPVDDLDAAKPVTNDKTRGIRGYIWAYTNEHILYTAGQRRRRKLARLRRRRSTTTKPPTSRRSRRCRRRSTASATSSPTRSSSASTIAIRSYHDLYLREHRRPASASCVQRTPGFAGFVTDDDYKVRFAIKPTDGRRARDAWSRTPTPSWQAGRS